MMSVKRVVCALIVISLSTAGLADWSLIRLAPGTRSTADGIWTGGIVFGNVNETSGYWHLGTGTFTPFNGFVSDTNGSIQVGAYNTGSEAHAALWTGWNPGSLTDLHPVAYRSSYIEATNGSSHVVTLVTQNGRYNAAGWSGTSNNVTLLHPAGASASHAHTMQGDTIVGEVILPGIGDRAAVWHGLKCKLAGPYALLRHRIIRGMYSRRNHHRHD